MGLSILTNIPSLTVQRHLDEGERKYSTALERLASGKRVNRPGDDAAGLSLGFSLEAEVRSMEQATRNAHDALSLIQVAGGGLNEVGNILIRLRELAIQAASDTVSDKERSMLMIETTKLEEEIDRIAESTTYLGTHLLNGQGQSFDFHIGTNAEETSRISYDASAVDIRASALGIDGIDLSDKDSAQDVLADIDEAIRNIGFPMSTVGANQARLLTAISHLGTYKENLSAARSRILDADLAQETSNFVQGQIQQKAAISVLSQANTLPQLALRLIE